MAKDKMSQRAIDSEVAGLVKAGHQKPKPKPASGDKLLRQIEAEAAARRGGKGR